MYNFRYDINGLRAYAVATVVLFHFGIFGFSGGFVGVDIFFVISGFLMTSITMKGIEQNKLSVLKFYMSRAVRIIPALYVLCIVLLIIGWFILLPIDYKALSKHIFSSINFVSNIVYYTESGYFNTVSHNKPLLHTWSLSVEWQFYIIFPLLLLILKKINQSKKFFVACFMVGTLISFALSVLITNKDASAGFFMLPTRAWEMLSGGLVFFASQHSIKSKAIKNSLELVGFILIVLSIYLFSSSTLWPSYNAIVPVFGAALVLLANNQNSLFTKPAIFQFFGNTSYSIYLWHWPIVFFLFYFQLMDNAILVCSGIVLSIILGFISYKYIETPTRNYFSSKSLKSNYISFISLIFILSSVSIFIFLNSGIKNRFNSHINQILDISMTNPKREECVIFPGEKLRSCDYGSGKLALLVVGDSHANAMMTGIASSLPKNTSLISWTISGCPLAEGLKKTTNPAYECGNLLTQTLKKVNEYPTNLPILIINRSNSLFKGEPDEEDISKPTRYITKIHQNYNIEYYNEMKNAYVNTLCKFAENHKVYVTRPTPESPNYVPSTYAKKLFWNSNHFKDSITFKQYLDRSNLAWEAQDIAHEKCGVQIIEIEKAFCDNTTCSFVKNGMPLMFDDDHVSWQTSLKLTPYFKEIFK